VDHLKTRLRLAYKNGIKAARSSARDLQKLGVKVARQNLVTAARAAGTFARSAGV
jgi:hypothetical protein